MSILFWVLISVGGLSFLMILFRIFPALATFIAEVVGEILENIIGDD